MLDAPVLDVLPDELLLSFAQFLGPRELLDFCATCKRCEHLTVDWVWRRLCAQAWSACPRYRLCPQREQWLDAHMKFDWKTRYRLIADDLRRTRTTPEELAELRWFFNFTPKAGGRGRQTLARARFDRTKVLVPGFTPLPYQVIDPSTDAEEPSASGDADPTAAEADMSQRVRQKIVKIRQMMTSLLWERREDRSEVLPQIVNIANFPPHWVHRLEDGEWLIYNDNVSFVSSAGDEPGSYDERGFLTVPETAAEPEDVS